MIYKDEFIMKYETVMFYPENDEKGNLHTCIYEGDRVYQVAVGPTELINTNLKYYASSLKGARESASLILGGKNMTPIVVNAIRGMCWFPSKSPASRDCIWFALHQIKDYEKIGERKTLVIFYNESTFELDVSYYSFDKRVKEAYKLKGKHEERTNGIPSRITETKEKFHFKKNKHNLNYGVDED